MSGMVYALLFSSFCFGVLAAAGVFTVFSTVTILPRMISKTKTRKSLLRYEDCVVVGTIFGSLISQYPNWLPIHEGIRRLHLGVVLQVCFGLFAGMFIGCLALAIAEMLDSIPIFTRRVSFQKGVGVAVLCMAFGKLFGSLFFFYAGIK